MYARVIEKLITERTDLYKIKIMLNCIQIKISVKRKASLIKKLFSMFLEKQGSQMGREESISGFPIAGSPLIGAIKRGIHEEVQVEPQERRNIQVSKMPGD